MSTPLSRKIIRIPLDTQNPEGLSIDGLTTSTPDLFNSSDVQMQFGVFIGPTIQDVSDFSSVTISIWPSQTFTGSPLATATVSAFDNTLDDSSWSDGTKQHFLANFTNAQMTFALGGAKSATFWASVTMITSDGTPRQMALGVFNLNVVESDGFQPKTGFQQNGNLVPNLAAYDGSGNYTLACTIGVNLRATFGAHDTSIDNGAANYTTDQVFATTATHLTLHGTPSTLVTLYLATQPYLTADESDARYLNDLRWRGAYNGATAYVPGDAVSYNGSSYRNKLASTGNVPTNTTYWDPVALKGDAGSNGTNGIDGTNGSTIATGSGAPSGGNDGDLYIRTSNYDLYKRITGTWTVIGNVKGRTGATGSTGLAGATWYNQAGVPSNGTGADGDYDLNQTNGDTYKKAGGVWALFGNIAGPSGAAATADTFDVTVSANSNTNINCSTNVIETVDVTVQAGAGAYTATFSLLTAGIAAGTVCYVRFELAASTNPKVQVWDTSTSGTKLFEQTADGRGVPIVSAFYFSGVQWRRLFAQYDE